MKNILQLIFALSIIFCSSQVKAQSWSPVSTGAFPTNTSGQIHGISRVSDVKFHPSISTKMYAVSARGGLFISNDAGNTWTMDLAAILLPMDYDSHRCVLTITTTK